MLAQVPPMGEAKQLETPKAQAAARISVLRDSFCNVDNMEKLGIWTKEKWMSD